MTRPCEKGQSTLEYVLVVTAVIAVIIAAVASNNSPFRRTMNATLNKGLTEMTTVTDRLYSGH